MTLSITKSVRLSPEESEELARLSEQTYITEASLLKKWVLEGIQAQKLEFAISQYMARKVDLRGGAALAGVSYNHFLKELELRHVAFLEDDRFLERLSKLADLYGDESLKELVNREITNPS